MYSIRINARMPKRAKLCRCDRRPIIGEACTTTMGAENEEEIEREPSHVSALEWKRMKAKR